MINFKFTKMPQQVNKRKGFQEAFQLEKLKKSIEKASREAGLFEEDILNIIEDISTFVIESLGDLETVDTESLRSLILSELDRKYPEVAEAWRNYDRTVKGRND